jgi:glycosyltransferase involved in cell wall biosynthesis
LKGVKDLLFWLKNSEANCKFVLTSDVTSSDYSKKLYDFFVQNLVADKVVWIGLQSQMKDLYAIADVVVSSSKRPESFGRTVLEALAVGTPVVGYNHGGVGEILDKIFPQGKVELNDCEALAIKINQTLDLAPVVPNNNPFLLTSMLDKTLAVYKDCIKYE